jgi:hypothetical protein
VIGMSGIRYIAKARVPQQGMAQDGPALPIVSKALQENRLRPTNRVASIQ